MKENRELPYCGIYREATGKTFLISKEMELPNGTTLSPDEKWIYVGSSDMKDPKMWRFHLRTEQARSSRWALHDDDAGWFDGIKPIRVEIFLQPVRVEFLSSLRKEKSLLQFGFLTLSPIAVSTKIRNSCT